MTLLGWTMTQWALAAAWYEIAKGKLPAPGIHGAGEVRVAWQSHRADEPGHGRIITGVAPEINFAWASAAFEQAFREIFSVRVRVE